jgi:hypothetical protein
MEMGRKILLSFLVLAITVFLGSCGAMQSMVQPTATVDTQTSKGGRVFTFAVFSIVKNARE